MRTSRPHALFAAALLMAAGALAAPRGARNPIPHEPLLVYMMDGGSIHGGTLELLNVYDDGRATFVRQVDGGPAKVRQAVAGDRVVRLMADLHRAGAMRLADLAGPAADVPLTTVTAFDYSGKAGAVNSFSYYAPSGSHAQVEQAVRSFVADVFSVY